MFRAAALAFIGLVAALILVWIMYPSEERNSGYALLAAIVFASSAGLYSAGNKAMGTAQRIALWLVVAGTAAGLLAATEGYWLDLVMPPSSPPTLASALQDLNNSLLVITILGWSMMAGVGGGWILWFGARLWKRRTIG
ncbi:MAG: hypothetical protein V4808_03665 [Pseudomonadota bacterium]